MQKLKQVIILLGIITLTSCEDPLTNNSPQHSNNECKLVKYNKLVNGNAIFYQTQLQYENNFITKRLNYGNIAPSTTGAYVFGLESKDSIVYNVNNLVEKIYYEKKGTATEKYDHFFYQPNNPNPFKRERIRNFQDISYTEKYTEMITYNNGKIIKTVGSYEDSPQYLTTKDYTYNTSGNLIKTIEEDHPNLNSFVTVETIDYSKYDTAINPFRSISVPFIENRNLKYSANNCRKISSAKTENGVLSSSSDWEIDNFQYNEHGYPLVGEYLCNLFNF